MGRRTNVTKRSVLVTMLMGALLATGCPGSPAHQQFQSLTGTDKKFYETLGKAEDRATYLEAKIPLCQALLSECSKNTQGACAEADACMAKLDHAYLELKALKPPSYWANQGELNTINGRYERVRAAVDEYKRLKYLFDQPLPDAAAQ